MRREVKQTKECNACNGRGERREMVNCYDTDWVGCQWCSGRGKIVVSTKVIQDTVEPFQKAKD